VERLVNMDVEGDSREAALSALIAAADPVVLTQSRRERVMNGTLERSRRRRSLITRRVLPIAVVGGLLMVGAATAASAAGRSWIARSWHRLSDAAAVGNPHAAGEPAESGADRRIRDRTHDPIAAADTAAAPRPRRYAPRRLHARAELGESPFLVVESVRLLRKDHDPEAARRLLREYLDRYPTGALAEEALALSIEAAAARLDRTEALRYANAYVRAYPDGRFRRVADEAIARGN
jgi:hypothetical protein